MTNTNHPIFAAALATGYQTSNLVASYKAMASWLRANGFYTAGRIGGRASSLRANITAKDVGDWVRVIVDCPSRDRGRMPRPIIAG